MSVNNYFDIEHGEYPRDISYPVLHDQNSLQNTRPQGKLVIQGKTAKLANFKLL